MTGTVKQDAEGMAQAVADVVESVGGGTAMTDAVAEVAASSDSFTIADGFTNKMFVAYAPFTA